MTKLVELFGGKKHIAPFCSSHVAGFLSANYVSVDLIGKMNQVILELDVNNYSKAFV